MTLSASIVWEVRTAGADTNGGGYVSGASGTDYSQQNAKNTVGNNISTTDAVANGSTTITSATAAFTSAIVGNIIYLAGGTGSLAAGWYQVTTFTNATTIVVDRIVASGTGITLNIGGALATPGQASANKVAGNTVWIQTGTYTLSTSTANTSGGPVSDTTGGTGNTGVTRWEGYQTSRGDKGTPPIIAVPGAGTYTSVNIFSCTINYVIIDNITCDGGGNASASMVAFNVGANYQHIVRCKGDRCSIGIQVANGNNVYMQRCQTTRCTSAGLKPNGGACVDCVSYANTGTADGFNTAGNTVDFLRCISYSNGGKGFNQGSIGCHFANCVAYGNSSDGFLFTSVESDLCENCIAYGNSGWGFNASNGASQLIYLLNCAGGSNTSGNYDNTKIIDSGPTKMVEGFVSLSGNPFTNAAAGDFSLNNTAGAGGACRAAGFPGVFPAGLTTGYLDIGAAQHQDTGGGGVTAPFIIGG